VPLIAHAALAGWPFSGDGNAASLAYLVVPGRLGAGSTVLARS